MVFNESNSNYALADKSLPVIGVTSSGLFQATGRAVREQSVVGAFAGGAQRAGATETPEMI
jgi:hypothetical protein